MIRFDTVMKYYGDTLALDCVSFDLPKGAIFALLGPNGAGKTTTIKIITGLIRDYRGRVDVDGQDIRECRLDVQSHIGYQPQTTGFQEWRTVDHALSTLGRLSGLTAEELGDRIAEVLERLGLSGYRHTKIVHLSGGTVQKLKLAQALLHRPRILILDEPLAGLDPAGRSQVKRIIRDYVAPNRLVLLSSHILSDVEDLADHIGIINKGTMTKVGRPEELRREFQLGDEIEVDLAGPAPQPGIWLDAGVKELHSAPGNRLRLVMETGTDPISAVHTVCSLVANQGIPIRGLRRAEASLEDVYLHYTKEAIGD